MGSLAGWLVGSIVVAFAVWEVARLRARTSRDRRLYALCERAGLACVPLDPFGDTSWLPFPMFGRERQATSNVIWNRERGADVRAFDFRYEDRSDDRTRSPSHELTCAVVPLGASAPPMRLEPRGLADEVRSVVEPQLSLELEAFDERFAVETQDQRFGVAFLEQRMMEALLALPDGVTVELNEAVLLLHAPLLEPEEVLRLFDAAVEIHERIPRSLPSLFPARPERGPHERRWLQGHWSPEPTA